MMQSAHQPTPSRPVPPLVDDPNLVGIERFEPSSTTLQAYYATRKRSKQTRFREGGFDLPGLFDTQHYPFDRTMFSVAMVLEVIGVIALGQVLYRASELPQWTTATIATVFVLFDVGLAYLHTWVMRSRASQLENDRLRIFPDMRSSYQDRSLKEYLSLDALHMPAWRVWLSAFFGLCIFASAVTKAVIFYFHWQDIQFQQAEAAGQLAAADSNAFAISLFVLLSYVVVAVIHYFYTGYFLLGLRQKHEEKKDRSKRNSSPDEFCLAYSRSIKLPPMSDFIRDLRDPRNQHQDFKGLCPDDEDKLAELRADEEPYTDVVTRSRRHRVHRADERSHRITAYGLLRDDDLIELVTAQPTRTARAAVTLYGHLLQLQIMEAARPRDQAGELTEADRRQPLPGA